MVWKLIIISLIIISLLSIANITGRNLIVLLLAIELLFFTLSVICLVMFYNSPSTAWNLDLLFMAIGITVLAAAETALGLAIIVRLYRRTKTIIIRKF